MPPVGDFADRLSAAVALAHPYEDLQRTVRGDGRDAGVLAGFAFDHAGEPSLLLTRRTDSVESHKGQIAFPGGVVDPEDLTDQGLVTTALRETEEEVGIPRSGIRVLGSLPELATFTGFQITPVIGVFSGKLEELVFRPNPAEIAEIFWAPLAKLHESGTYRREFIQAGAVRYPIHAYYVGGHRVWGATAAVIKNLLDRLARLG